MLGFVWKCKRHLHNRKFDQENHGGRKFDKKNHGDSKFDKENHSLLSGFKHFLFSIIYGIILPIDELIFFKMVETTNQ